MMKFLMFQPKLVEALETTGPRPKRIWTAVCLTYAPGSGSVMVRHAVSKMAAVLVHMSVHAPPGMQTWMVTVSSAATPKNRSKERYTRVKPTVEKAFEII